MDITPNVPEGRQIIESYGEGGFRISGERYEGSRIVTPDEVFGWPVSDPYGLSETSLSDILDSRAIEVVLLGCGAKMLLLPRALREAWRSQGLVVEVMDTGAACRTYNVLMTEERRVAAALIAI